MAKFMILSLPRSRSTWMSHFLSYRGSRCEHDLLVYCGSIFQFEDALSQCDGSCETAAMVGWKLIVQRYPHIRLVVVKRPLEEVIRSLANKGFTIDPAFIEARAHMLDAVSNLPGVLTFTYEQLQEESVCKEIFEFCLQTPFDYEWWDEMRRKDIQIDLKERFMCLQENANALANLNAEVIAETAKLGASTCLHLN